MEAGFKQVHTPHLLYTRILDPYTSISKIKNYRNDGGTELYIIGLEFESQ